MLTPWIAWQISLIFAWIAEGNYAYWDFGNEQYKCAVQGLGITTNGNENCRIHEMNGRSVRQSGLTFIALRIRRNIDVVLLYSLELRLNKGVHKE
jgi:hypothetical protein